MGIGSCCDTARNVQPRLRQRGDVLLPVHDSPRRHEREGRCDGREHSGPDSITFTNASRNNTSDANIVSQSSAFADSDGYALANGRSDGDFGSHGSSAVDQYAVAVHERDSRTDDRHAGPDAAGDIGSVVESYDDSRTNGGARCDHERDASAGSIDAANGGRRPGLASERSGSGCWGASVRRWLALDK